MTGFSTSPDRGSKKIRISNKQDENDKMIITNLKHT